MRSRSRFIFSLCVVLIVAFGSNAYAQKKYAWDQPAPVGDTAFTTQQAQGYIYTQYIRPATTGTVLSGVTCTTTAAALVKACTAPLPPGLAPGSVVDLTASDGTTESGHSNTATFTIPSNPSNFKIAMRRFLKTPALASKRFFTGR